MRLWYYHVDTEYNLVTGVMGAMNHEMKVASGSQEIENEIIPKAL